MSTEENKVVLKHAGNEYEMDIKQSTEGDSGFDISNLRKETGLVTFDPGYTSTGSTESKITFINGEEGILRYRGYDIAELANKATFNEVSYLLIKGHLPDEQELAEFNKSIRHHTLLDEDFKAQFNIFPRDAHPMAVLASSVNILSSYYQDQLDPLDEKQLDKATVRLMGFGHRVYKNYDPRAAIVKDTAHEIIDHLGGDSMLDLAMKLEEIALSDDYFVSRKLYPNVDFYTGLIYRAMGFPTDFFTVLFAIGRLPGWIAQYREQLEMNTKINRPRQIYTGETLRKVTPRSER